jgi:hypothetical protein
VTQPEPERAGPDLEIQERLEEASAEEAETIRARQVAAIARLVRRATIERQKGPVDGAARRLGASSSMRQHRGVMDQAQTEEEMG